MELKNRLDGIKVIFFDIDGVLAKPVYESICNFSPLTTRIGASMSDADWWGYNVGSVGDEDNTYKLCKKSATIHEFMRMLVDKGIIIKCLTEEYISDAYFNKADWVLKNYPDIFKNYRDIAFVGDKKDKITYMAAYIKHNNYYVKNSLPLQRKQVMLIDDTYPTVCAAENAGFRALHVSNLFD